MFCECTLDELSKRCMIYLGLVIAVIFWGNMTIHEELFLHVS